MTTPYGCHNRPDYKGTLQVQEGWVNVPDTNMRVAVMRTIPFTGSMDCNYTHTELGQCDARCEGCARKAPNKEAP